MENTAQEILDFVNRNRRRFTCVTFFGFFEAIDGKLMLKEVDWHDVEFGINFDDEQLLNDLKQEESWHEHLGKDTEIKSGYYSVQAALRIETDGDDFRDWSWYELELADIEWAHEKFTDEYPGPGDDSMDDLFNFQL